MAPARTLTWLPLALSTVLAGCAYISDEDEKWRLDPDDDGVQLEDDCDDTNGDLAEEVTWFTDGDGDGFGAPGTEESGCEAPAGSADNGDDCDDANSSVFPEAPDAWYDGVDSNCLGDDDFDQDGDGYTNDVDCDDEDPSRAPDESVAETYFNGIDDNCDTTDQDGDQDGDTYWAADYIERVEAAGATPLAVPDGKAGDCWDDDSDVPDAQRVIAGFPTLGAADVNPGAAETWYDSADQDCGGLDDNGDGVADDFDQDSDGFASLTDPNREGETGTDCDDSTAAVNPGVTEIWYDGVDADCGGEDDYDADGDLYQAAAHGGDDCNDTDPTVNPGALDFWYDGVDQDCGGEDDYDADSDGDQSADWGGFDCDDWDASISSLATETWYDGVDTDCNGGSDYDADGDGYDSSEELARGLDCDDDNAAANPSMSEICDNGFDDDCDGSGDSSAGLCWLEGELDIAAADVMVQGSGSGHYVGNTVGVGGDVDGDGTDDWAFGISGDDTTATSAGAVYLDSIPSAGSSQTAESYSTVLLGADAGDRLGASVVIGDLNGDGIDDIATGASSRDELTSNGGAGYIVFGPIVPNSYTITSVSDVTIGGSSSGSSLGTQAALLGDQDADGADELLLTGSSSNGFVAIASGLSSGSTPSVSLPRITGASSADNFAYALDGTGDLDGDGVDDLVVGAPTVNVAGSTSAGAAYVFHGPLTASASASDGEAFLGTSGNAYVGYSVGLGGDVDGDGLDDLIVGATGMLATSGGSPGGAFLIHGPATSGGTIAARADATLGAPFNGNCGRHVSVDGDIDGDGAADIVVGCQTASISAAYGGAAYLMYAAPSGSVNLGTSMAVFAGSQTSEFASKPFSIPDQNGDGYDEIAIGAGSYDNASGSAGRLGMWFGGSW